jgi:spore coat polysaccharide biosynthesis predicted glycosyltransferase SpsG
VLLIIDSYGPHINLAKSEKLEKRNIFIELESPNKTGVLQSLDVAVNKSFQEAFEIENHDMQTKVPNYVIVSNWVVDWANAFEIQSDNYFATILESE